MPASGLREAVMADATVARSYPFGPIHGLEIDPMYFWLQEHEPLARVKLPYGEEGWLLTRYDDVRTALGDARFSLAEAAVRDVPRLTPQRYGGILTDQDPPEHTRLRRLVAKAFTARRVEQLRGWVGAWMSVTALTPEQRGEYIAQLAGYVAALAAQRRQTPTDDLLGALVTAQEEGDRLTEDEVVQLTLVILAAGYESTASQIVNFTYALLTHPDQLALLRSRPDLMPGAVEELMRWVPLLAVADVLPRYALADVELSGGTVRAGEPVLLAKHAANRDPRRYDDPDRLDITCDAQGELGFGHGAHHCLGAPLARMDIQTALTALLQRFPNLRLAVPESELEWKTGMAVRGPVALPIAW